MAITRRQFLKSGSTAAAGALLAPRLFGSSFVQDALAAIGNRYFVVLYLDGGNDGLNTVVPTGGVLRPWYESARKTGPGGLRLELADLANTAIGNDPNGHGSLALHPGFAASPAGAGGPGEGGLWQLYHDGHVAVVQGCGYPSYSLSHEDSRLIFQTADPSLSLYSGNGWVGRLLASEYAGQSTAIPAVNVNDSVAGDYRQSATSVLAIRRLRDFSFPYDSVYDSTGEKSARNTAFNALHAAAQAGVDQGFKYIGTAGATTLASTNAYPALHSLYENNPTRSMFSKLYDNGTPVGVNRSTARDLREIAKVIWGTEQGMVNSRFFWVENAGYDTHSDQGAGASDGQQFGLHSEIGASLKVFYDDLVSMNVADRVTIMVYSEFSRRVEQNDNGTDHGSQGPMFLIGGKVAGGVYGNHPRIDPAQLDGEGNTRYRQAGSNNGFESTDFRDVYGTILNKWMGVNPLSFLTLDSGDPTRNWTVGNFNMPIFLP
jgi:uncharacterized protein (DUF1501 family)